MSALLRARGLPQLLPAGERLLWQGVPVAATLRRYAFHIRGIAIYFAVILALCVFSEWRHGWPANAILVATAHKAALALVPLLLIALYAWGISRSTIYTITSRRVVISFGMAIPVSFNIPFARIHGAGMRRFADGTGDVPLQLSANDRMSYLVMWPHARPWRMARTEPMLRAVPDVEKVAAILSRALAAFAAGQAVMPAPRPSFAPTDLAVAAE